MAPLSENPRVDPFWRYWDRRVMRAISSFCFSAIVIFFTLDASRLAEASVIS